jgi:hypothetical protein
MVVWQHRRHCVDALGQRGRRIFECGEPNTGQCRTDHGGEHSLHASDQRRRWCRVTAHHQRQCRCQQRQCGYRPGASDIGNRGDTGPCADHIHCCGQHLRRCFGRHHGGRAHHAGDCRASTGHRNRRLGVSADHQQWCNRNHCGPRQGQHIHHCRAGHGQCSGLSQHRSDIYRQDTVWRRVVTWQHQHFGPRGSLHPGHARLGQQQWRESDHHGLRHHQPGGDVCRRFFR